MNILQITLLIPTSFLILIQQNFSYKLYSILTAYIKFFLFTFSKNSKKNKLYNIYIMHYYRN